MAETPRGSVHESPFRGQRTRPTLKAAAPSLECITENSCEANAGTGQLHIDSRRNSTVVAVCFDVCHSDKGKTYRGFNARWTTDLSD
jgi:polyferredoxin